MCECENLNFHYLCKVRNANKIITTFKEEKMEDLVEFLDRNIENLMKELGFTQQIPQEKKKENAPISGSITFIGNGELKKMRDKVDKEMNEQRSQRKKENK